MLTFIIPLLLGSIIGFLIRGKPSDTFAITTGKRVAWAIGFGFGGLLIGMPIGLAISSTTGPQIAGLIATGLWLGVLNILSIKNATYKKWSERKLFAWVCGAIVTLPLLAGFLPNEIRGIFSSYERDSVTKSAVPSVALGGKDAKAAELPNNYLGVTLGDSEQQVRYVLGEPTERKEVGEGALRFRYGSTWIFLGGRSKTVVLIECGDSEGCPSLFGINIGDEESKVKAALGSEAMISLEEQDRNGKIVVKKFTRRNGNTITVYLTQQRVVGLALLKGD
jgi:hypothetical protein